MLQTKKFVKTKWKKILEKEKVILHLLSFIFKFYQFQLFYIFSLMIRGKEFSCNIVNSRIFCEMFKKIMCLYPSITFNYLE